MPTHLLRLSSPFSKKPTVAAMRFSIQEYAKRSPLHPRGLQPHLSSNQCGESVRFTSGNRFCEWGSGLGTATCLASLMGFNAMGIEIEPELVLRARRLASEFNLPASFLQTSFLIEGYDFLPTQEDSNCSCQVEIPPWE